MAKKIINFARNSIILTAMLIVLVVLAVIYVNSLTGFIIKNPYAAKITPTIVSYYGGEPKINGIVAKGEWDDAGFSKINYEGGVVKIASKHDDTNFYFLLQWADENPSWNYAPHFYFEQDDYTHDLVLDGKNDYSFALSQGHCYERGSSASWSGYYDKWVEYGGSDATAECSYSLAEKTWTVEVKKPLVNNDLKLISIQISGKKSYNLGFALINWQNNVEGGFAASSWNWPHDRNINSAPGNYTVTGDTETWGALNVIWTRKPATTK